MRNLLKVLWGRLKVLLYRSPMVSFFVLVVLLFGVIVLGALWRTPAPEPTLAAPEAKTTALFTVGQDTPFLSVPAEVRKENLTRIVALTPGMVTGIWVKPGQVVAAGKTLLTLTNDYGGGSAGIQKNIAVLNQRLVDETFSLNQRINELEQKQARRNDALTDLQESIELKKLKVAREALSAERERTALSTKLSQTNDAVLRPKTFTQGTVEGIAVRVGDYVNPGTVLATIRSTRGGVSTLEALVTARTARLFDPEREAVLSLEDGEMLRLRPTYFSTEETQDGLYSILFTLSEAARSKVQDGAFVSLSLPLMPVRETSVLVPLDAVFQNRTGAWVMIVDNGIARSRAVTLGTLHGSFAEIESGLAKDDAIILNRAVLPGEEVAPAQAGRAL